MLRETFFHENISVAIEKRALIAIIMGIRESFFREDLCDALTAKVFCLETFMVYGKLTLSRLTIVSREAKKKQAVRDEQVSYLHVAPL